MSRAIVLVGLRCAGKSSVGRCLADELGLPFVDLDEELAALEAEAKGLKALVRDKKKRWATIAGEIAAVASAELGRQFIDGKVEVAVARIRELVR